MQRIALIILLSILILPELKAQFKENNSLYYTFEGKFGNFYGARLELNYIYKENVSLSFGISGHIRRAVSEPYDYKKAEHIFSFLDFQRPRDRVRNIHLTVGKVVALNNNEKVRFVFSGGLEFSVVKYPGDWAPVSLDENGENYTYSIQRFKTVSFILNPKIEFPVSKVFGLVISPTIEINKGYTFYGVGMGYTLGLLRAS